MRAEQTTIGRHARTLAGKLAPMLFRKTPLEEGVDECLERWWERTEKGLVPGQLDIEPVLLKADGTLTAEELVDQATTNYANLRGQTLSLLSYPSETLAALGGSALMLHGFKHYAVSAYGTATAHFDEAQTAYLGEENLKWALRATEMLLRASWRAGDTVQHSSAMGFRDHLIDLGVSPH
jgi:hypothetical protein